MAGYTLIGSYSTVQVLSPTLVNPIEYCTIQTSPSGSVASIPVQENVFSAGQAGVELTNFADAIEQILADSRVIAATGTQTIDANGLLSDQVVFTVEYTPPGNVSTSVTAEASVPVAQLNFTDGTIGSVLLEGVQAIIDGVYANLQAAAGG